jgi:hypothetical protein
MKRKKHQLLLNEMFSWGSERIMENNKAGASVMHL